MLFQTCMMFLLLWNTGVFYLFFYIESKKNLNIFLLCSTEESKVNDKFHFDLIYAVSQDYYIYRKCYLHILAGKILQKGHKHLQTLCEWELIASFMHWDVQIPLQELRDSLDKLLSLSTSTKEPFPCLFQSFWLTLFFLNQLFSNSSWETNPQVASHFGLWGHVKKKEMTSWPDRVLQTCSYANTALCEDLLCAWLADFRFHGERWGLFWSLRWESSSLSVLKKCFLQNLALVMSVNHIKMRSLEEGK